MGGQTSASGGRKHFWGFSGLEGLRGQGFRVQSLGLNGELDGKEHGTRNAR